VTFTSSDPSVVTVSSAGVVKSVGPDGTATVTAASGALTAPVTVFVGEAPPGTILSTVPLLGAPWGVAVTAAGKYYVAAAGGTIYAGAFPAYGFPTSFEAGSQALSIAVDAAGTTGYIAQGFDGTNTGIAIVDLGTNTITDIIPMPGATALCVALSQDENTLLVGTDGGLQVIDVPSKSVTGANLAPGSVNQITRHPTSALLYATVYGGPIIEINGATRAIVRSFAATGTVQGTAVSLDGTELYIAEEGDELQIWNLATGQLVQSLPGLGGFGLALSPDGAFIYTATAYGGQVRIIDRASRALVRTVTTGGAPRRIAFDPASGTAVVTNEAGWVDFVK
jgi:YVTN family beta-propeller protein